MLKELSLRALRFLFRVNFLGVRLDMRTKRIKVSFGT